MAQRNRRVWICGAARTPHGAFGGALADRPATALGAVAIRGALRQADAPAEAVQELLMGQVLQAGCGQAPARQAALGAGLPRSVPCTTVNKVCGSGMKTLMMAHDAILAGSAGLIVAGGMESMSRAPYLLDRARTGYRLGHGGLLDHMFLDGLEDAYESGRLMGSFAEDCAAGYGISRADQDAYALRSLEKVQQARSHGLFAAELVPVADLLDEDEPPRRARPERIPSLRPAFRPDGTVTAANASSIADGAAALVVASDRMVETLKLQPLAALRAHASHAQTPADFSTAPVAAIGSLLERLDWPLDSVDLFEINEAFAVTVLVIMQSLGLDPNRVNVQGGACALGHPIGASGARSVVTLAHALARRGLQRGIAAVCIGGGEATAVAVERLP